MKKYLTKILLCICMIAFCGIAFVACDFSNDDDMNYQVPVVTSAFFSKCIDDDAELLKDKLSDDDYVILKNYEEFIALFKEHSYSDYSHLLMLYKGFNFFDFNMILLRTEPVRKSKTINILGFFSGQILSSSDEGEGMHYYIAILEKSEQSLIIC